MKFLRATLPLDAVSRHRAALYGVAALWLMFFHSPIPIPEGEALGQILLWLKHSAGTCCVEIFVLLSPMGLYRSLESGRGLASFYRRRLLRVALPAFIVAAFFHGIGAGSLKDYALALTFFSYWFGGPVFWYVAFILTMYLVYPALHALGRRSPRALWALFALSFPLTLLAERALPGWSSLCAGGIDRIPAFLLGCALAPALVRGGRVPAWACVAVTAVYVPVASYTFALGGVRSFWLLSVCNLLLAIPMIAVLTAAAEWLARGAARRYFYRLLAMAGAVSLEIYLLYSRLLGLLAQTEAYRSGAASDGRRVLAAVVLTPLASVALSAFCRTLERSFHATRAPKIDAKG